MKKQHTQAYRKLAGWRRKADSTVDRVSRDNEDSYGDRGREDAADNEDQFSEDEDSISELVSAANDLKDRAEEADDNLANVNPVDYDDKERRAWLRDSISDVIDAFTEVNNTFASTDWEISSRKSAQRRVSRKASNNIERAVSSFVEILQRAVTVGQRAASSVNAMDAHSGIEYDDAMEAHGYLDDLDSAIEELSTARDEIVDRLSSLEKPDTAE